MAARSGPTLRIALQASLALSATGLLPIATTLQARAEAPNAEAIELSGDLELSRLVELVSQRLGVSVQYTAADLNKRVTLRLRGPVTDEDLWRILTAALESQQLAIVRTEQPGLFRVLPMQQAAAQPPELRVSPIADGAVEVPEIPGVPGGDPGDPGASFVSTIVQLRSADPAEIAMALAPALTPQIGQAKPIGAGGLLLISDLRQRVDLALALIERLDGPADPAVRFIVDLRQASATETAALAQQALTARLGMSNRRAAPSAAGAAGAFAATGVQLLALPDDQRLMIIASASQEEELRRLIDELDVREALETRSYSAPGIDPKDLAETIKGLLETRAAESMRGQAAPTRVAADKLSGAVLVTARTRDHERIGELIARIQAAPPSSRRTLQSFVVRNRSASELLATLQQLLSSDPGGLSTISAEGLNGAGPIIGDRSGVSGPTSPLLTNTPANRAMAAAGDPAVGLSGSSTPSGPQNASGGLPGVTVDEATNTILAVGDPISLAQLGALITALDVRQPQVMIEVSLVSLSEGQAIDFGVELRTQFERGGTTFNLSSLFGLGTGAALPTGVGFTGVAINPGDFEVVVRALETVDAGRSASTPKVLVNNSQTASLRAVLRQPFTSINASETVATTSFGGTQDAGTTVTVTPQIAAGDHLILQYAVELSAFTGESTTLPGGGVVPPPSQQNTIDASATIPDGFTVIVGGLETVANGKNNTRVPLLGQIPILGWLFGTESDSQSRQRFYVFIRATVLRDAGFADLKRLSGPDFAAARPSLGEATGAPELQPLWID